MIRTLAAVALLAVLTASCGPPPVKDTTFSGQLVYANHEAPADAKVHVEVRDNSEVGASAVLGAQDGPVAASPIPFSFIVPGAKVPERPVLTIAAEIKDNEGVVIFTSGSPKPVTLESAASPMTIQLVFVPPQTTPYKCADKDIGFALQAERVYVLPEDHSVHTLPVIPGAKEGAPVSFTDGKMTVTVKTLATGPEITFKPSAAAPAAKCAKV